VPSMTSALILALHPRGISWDEIDQSTSFIYETVNNGVLTAADFAQLRGLRTKRSNPMFRPLRPARQSLLRSALTCWQPHQPKLTGGLFNAPCALGSRSMWGISNQACCAAIVDYPISALHCVSSNSFPGVAENREHASNQGHYYPEPSQPSTRPAWCRQALINWT